MSVSPDALGALQALIGSPYSNTDERPGYHCWGLFCEVQRILGRDGLPRIVLERMTAASQGDALLHHGERENWREIPAPVHGAAVMLGRSRLPIHIGAFVGIDGGGVLHATPKLGVVFETLETLRFAGWRYQTFLVPVT
ncbi:hypothetical protein H2509_20585 [Stappia sp. F7233]|uniref:NlpC/P60 domain-containing protein n=1 Tax=Stappia albiluteola TaxID=2758565 RepID=A0A839AK70_9HYPH|nr:hypothetical protein [Stappia albiluteola]MBA5779535.1 hypothetical protein [Stappia albiluteola]